MPIYEYRCEEGHTFEAFQTMSEDPLRICEVCGASASRRLSAPAIHYKGSGFYTTDYARKGAKRGASDGDSDTGSKDSASGSGDSGSGDSGSGDSGSGSGDSGSKASEKSSGSGSSEKAASSSSSS